MFDPAQSFAAQFTPVDDGYLYYPTRKSGGKLVTADEYQDLLEAWRRRSNPWKIALVGVVLIVTWTIVSDAFAPPTWSESLFIGVLVTAICGWIFWAAYAPRRLVKGRPEVVPPRPLSEARRKARATLNWPFVSLILLATGVIFVAVLIAPEYTFRWWAWTVGSGLMFVAYLWIALLKFRDRERP